MAKTCPNCSAELTGHSCKLRCPRCHYFESCSDLEPYPVDPPQCDVVPRDAKTTPRDGRS